MARSLKQMKARIALLITACKTLERGMLPVSIYDAQNEDREKRIKRIEDHNREIEELIDEGIRQGGDDDWHNW